MNILEEMAKAHFEQWAKEFMGVPNGEIYADIQGVSRMSAAVQVLRDKGMLNELGLQAIKQAEKEKER